jgi:hypothetical protein
MNDIRTTAGTVLPISATVLAYVVVLGLPVMVPPNPVQILVSASCSTLAVVTMSRLVRSGPVWARVVTVVVTLPLLAHVVMILWSAVTGGLHPGHA